MIYAIGVASDGTLAYFATEAARQAAPVTLIDLGEIVAGGNWRLSIPDDGESWVNAGGQRYDLTAADAYYCRLVDLSALTDEPGIALRWRCLARALGAWLDQVPTVVVNRPGTPSDNGSKPLHEAMLARWGFTVPESLTSSSRDRLRDFAATGGTIVKTLSGVRADSRLVTPAEFDAFVAAQGPVHLQRHIRGADVRVHVCGDEVHAERARSGAVDYRAAAEHEVSYDPYPLPAALAAQMIAYGRDAGLTFTGWDLKVDEAGRHWCLEVNPMPGYDSYDRRLGGVITAALLRMLYAREDT
jgi:glutathione synthase/RimK-type ligase-like ATP-grasp enzyme